MKVITRELLAEVSAEAKHNPRLRKNYNLHPSDESRCHRLLNAIEPGSYIRPHRHLDPEKDEAFILLNGRLGIVTFADNGAVSGTVLLSLDSGNLAVDIPHGVYHTAVALESGTVFYETKAGPYRLLNDDETVAWAPEDTDPQADEFVLRLRSLFG
ncbi:MAG: WbuC family cupin fold metalloprotein [Desulfuromonadaceae bacterium]|nr:WbuC family cupin fold metalloprotein [Desulfuromonadaceae bacterium]